MPTPTYDLLASNVLSSTTATVAFTSLSTIASGYRDLILACDVRSSRTNSSSDDMQFFFNSGAAGTYDGRSMIGTGSSPTDQSSSSSQTEISGINTSLSGNTIMTKIHFQLFDFSQTDKHKSFLFRRDDSNIFTQASAQKWANTDAITSIHFDLSSGNFVAGSTFYLYGVAA